MKNNKEKKTKLDLDRLTLSLSNNTTTQSTRNKIEFKLDALFVYLLMIKINKKKINYNLKKFQNKINYLKSHKIYIERIENKKILNFNKKNIFSNDFSNS